MLTTKDDVLPMDAIVVHPTGIYAYCVNKKAKLPRAEKAINEILNCPAPGSQYENYRRAVFL